MSGKVVKRDLKSINSLLNLQGTTWIASNIDEQLPVSAFRAGMDTDGSAIYVGKTFAMGDYLVVKIIPFKKTASASHDGKEIPVYSFGVLCGTGYSWVESRYGEVPQGSVVGGQTANGEILYIGRASFQGSLTPGKIHQSHACLYIPFEGREVSIGHYEALVQTQKNEHIYRGSPNLQLNIPQNIQISTPSSNSNNYQNIIEPQYMINHRNLIQNQHHFVPNSQSAQNIMMNGQIAHNFVTNGHLTPILIPNLINVPHHAPQIVQNAKTNVSIVQKTFSNDSYAQVFSKNDPNLQNTLNNGPAAPSFYFTSSAPQMPQILPQNTMPNGTIVQKLPQTGLEAQKPIPQYPDAQNSILNGINKKPPLHNDLIINPMQNLQLNDEQESPVASQKPLLNTNPFRTDNVSPPVRAPSAPIVLPDVRIPPPKPPVIVKGYYNVPPPQLPPDYRPYKEHFPMITELNDLAKANKLSVNKISKISASSTENNPLAAVFSTASTTSIGAINFSVPPPNYAKIIQLNLPVDEPTKSVKPVVSVNSDSVISVKPANAVFNSSNQVVQPKLINHVTQKPPSTNGQKVQEKLSMKQMKEAQIQPTQEDDSCVICLDAPSDAVLYKCGHQMCYNCAFNQWKAPNGGTCPICRAIIGDVIRIFKV